LRAHFGVKQLTPRYTHPQIFSYVPLQPDLQKTSWLSSYINYQQTTS